VGNAVRDRRNDRRPRDFHFRDSCGAEIARYPEHTEEITSLVRMALAAPKAFPPLYKGLRVIRH
jgi:hypothetical protein